ncbi:MAG: DUF3160 domain-containing protein [Lentimicrobiaceae bacterium]|nr:DUF3160 domain-containing protein [Lentimicrobiaceae bacterium]
MGGGITPKYATGAYVAVVVEQNRQQELKFWTIGTSEISEDCPLPKDFKAETIVWHPMANALFVLGTEKASSLVYRMEKTKREWTCKSIFSSKQKLQNMVIGPQPFIIEYDRNTRKEHYAYRLFLGMDNGDNTYRIVSITEHGSRFYQVVGPQKTQTTNIDDYMADDVPSIMKADWALPMAFHPNGNQLIWQDKQRNFFVATYERKFWGKSTPMFIPLKNKESLIPTPNGLGMIAWQKNKAGIELYLIPEKSSSCQLNEYQFETAPVSVPDGKGIIGKTIKNGISTLHYAPVNMPLPNVLNAWMFIHSEKELDLFKNQYGLFRPTNHEQLYELYETENYYCNSYDRCSSARPYLVTTDIFWELFAAAYQGVFIIKEREEAIPNFWQFIEKADNYFKINNKSPEWNAVFTILKDLRANRTSNEEVLRIINEDNDISDVTQKYYAFSDLKPRGHYTTSADMKLYFKAFRYFTTILYHPDYQDILMKLENLPSDISQYALNWINSYSDFIAPSRSALVWKNYKTTIPQYCQYPKNGKAIFPLSWGFDNEVFYSTVYHENFPADKRIEGANEARRFLPSGVDIAAVLGSGLADKLMADEYAKYPPLRKMIDNLRSNYKTHSNDSDFKTNLYNQWMNAMAVQWTDSVTSTSGKNGEAIWKVKRLQTGLATWATLRHATVLVNERVAAECGEGGFEEILMKSPRGSVEADPYTFRAIATLFQEILKTASKLKSNDAGKQAVYNGLVKRLAEAAEETLLFAAMAEKERKGEKLTNEEYQKVLWVARVAEHLFLVFYSLKDEEYGLPTPDPIGKITDVADNGGLLSGQNDDPRVLKFLMAAVGNPLEWNYVVPYYGRYQIVKGSVYSYYEFESAELLNDEQWRKKADKQPLLPWIKSHITSSATSWGTGY